jgi:hypothetical protein
MLQNSQVMLRYVTLCYVIANEIVNTNIDTQPGRGKGCTHLSGFLVLLSLLSRMLYHVILYHVIVKTKTDTHRQHLSGFLVLLSFLSRRGVAVRVHQDTVHLG